MWRAYDGACQTRWGEADLVPRLREALTDPVRLDRVHRI